MDKLAYLGGTKTIKDGSFKWPYSDEEEINNILDVFTTGNWWRMSGNKVEQFEREFAVKHGTQFCLGVTNGTHALELAMSALKIGKGDEVIVPAITFISTVSAVIYCNATPVIVDVDPKTYCIDVSEFQKAITPKTKAVIPVHLAGNACNMEEICAISKKFGIYVIEDAAHAHGGKYKGKSLGSFGDVSIFSFQNGKIMTCGEGGALITNNREIYERAFLLHGVGRPKGDTKYVHKVIGSNYRMSEFQAAILLAQLNRLDKFNKYREMNASLLDKLLSEIDGIIPQSKNCETTVMTHYMYMFHYDSKYFNGLDRELFIELLKAEGIPSFVCFPVLSDTECFINHKNPPRPFEYINSSSLERAHDIADNVVWIPHYVLLGSKENIYLIRDAIIKIQKLTRNKEILDLIQR